MGFWTLFKDDNVYDEKNIIGFISFGIMVIIALTDVVSGVVGSPFIINDYIYNSFLIITLGSFGISEAGKILGHKDKDNGRSDYQSRGGFGRGTSSRDQYNSD